MVHLELKELLFLFLLPCIDITFLEVALVQSCDTSFYLGNFVDLPLFFILELLDLFD